LKDRDELLPSSFPELGGDVAADRTKADRWIAERQRELATVGIRLQALQEPRSPGPPDFTQIGEPGFLANELLGAFEPCHEFFQPVGMLLRDFHEHLSAKPIHCQAALARRK
jgi:hypothetical protein